MYARLRFPTHTRHVYCMYLDKNSLWTILRRKMRRNHSLRVYTHGSCHCGGPKLLRMAIFVERETTPFTRRFPLFPFPPLSPISLGPPLKRWSRSLRTFVSAILTQTSASGCLPDRTLSSLFQFCDGG